MGQVKVREELPRRSCSADRLKKLHKIGFANEGYDRELEKIITGLGYNLPKQQEINQDTYYGFHIGKYQHYFMNYADACAEQILFIHEKFFKNRTNGKQKIK